MKQNNIDQEEIQDLGVGQDKMGYQKYTMKDINLPTNCRLQCRTLKIDILADIIIKLTTWSEPEGQGEEVDRRQEIMS